MKKLIFIFGIVLSLSSCSHGLDDKDKVLSMVIDIEISHLKTYNKLQKMSKDTAVVNYITKLKDSLKLDAVKSQGVLDAKSGILIGPLTTSKIKLNNYVNLCK